MRRVSLTLAALSFVLAVAFAVPVSVFTPGGPSYLLMIGEVSVGLDLWSTRFYWHHNKFVFVDHFWTVLVFLIWPVTYLVLYLKRARKDRSRGFQVQSPSVQEDRSV